MKKLISFFSFLVPHRRFSPSMSETLNRADRVQEEALRTLKNYRVELVLDMPVKVRKRNANPS